MAVAERKSLIPVKETIIVPYNNGATYTSGTTITLLFGAGQGNTWLVQDSFIQFNYLLTMTQTTPTDYFIRDINMIFDWVEVVYQGKQITIQNFNQQMQFIKWVQKGGDYLDAELYSNTTSKNIDYTRLKITSGTSSAPSANNKLVGCIIRIAELFDLFEHVTEFPLNALDNQIQLNFHLAHPSTYLMTATESAEVDGLYLFKPIPSTTTISYDSFRIERFELHLKDKVEMAEGLDSNEAFKINYEMNQVALRSVEAKDFSAGMSLNLPFSIVTENVDSMGIYFYKEGNPCIAYRPELINVNFKYGNYNSPFSPINVDSYTNPGVYKGVTNDTFDITTAYFATSNYDFNMSYPYLDYASAASGDTAKEDCHVVLATDFVTDDGVIGAPSSTWNSQYIFQANASGQGLDDSTACMWVKSRYLAFIRNGQLESVNV